MTDSLDAGRVVDANPGEGVVVDLHAERLVIDVLSYPAQRVRIYRDVITEEVMVPVTVRREVLRVEVDDLPPDGTPAVDEPPGSWEERATHPVEIILREERPRVEVDVVAVERVLVGTVIRTTQTQISDTVRHEEIAVTGVPGGRHVRST